MSSSNMAPDVKSVSKSYRKSVYIPNYGMAMLNHLCSEYHEIVSRRNLNKAELVWQEKVISEKESMDRSSVGWDDICDAENAVLSVVEDEGLVSKYRIIQERYKIVVSPEKYKSYEDSIPKSIAKLAEIDISKDDVKKILRSHMHYLISQLYWIYESTMQSSVLRYNSKWYVTVFLGSLILVTLILIGNDWREAVKGCPSDIQYTFPVVGVIVLMGACGACVSFLRRLSQLPSNIESLSAIIELRKSWVDVALAIVSGSFFSIFLLVILASDLPQAIFSAKFLPKFCTPACFQCIKGQPGTLIGFIKGLYVDSTRDMALILILSFIAGFAEQFVPDVINRLIRLSEEGVSKKS